MTDHSSSPDIPFLLIDKPQGITSHDVVNIVRRKKQIKRVGHAGTLDPLATGLLIILVGREATKHQDEFMHMDKEYECTGQLGVTTDSYDREGKVTAQAPWQELQKITQEDIEKILPQFRGTISQTVPIYSAVKVQGKKLYEVARQGKTLAAELPTRQVKIFSLELTEFTKNEGDTTLSFSLRVHCSSGTYIRSLVHDIGQVLKVGATVTRLRRTKIGKYDVKNAIPPQEIE